MTREFRRHHHTRPHGRPEGVHRLDMFFDYSAFPVRGQALVPVRGGRPARETATEPSGSRTPSRQSLETGI